MTARVEVEEAYEEYADALAKAKRQAKREMEDRVLELTQDSRVELSEAVHSAHRSGVRVDELRRIVRAYNNASVWNPIWDAAKPEVPTDLRRSAVPVKKENGLWVELDDGTIQVGDYVVTDIRWTDAEDKDAGVEFVAVPEPEEFGEDYLHLWRTATKYLKEVSDAHKN